MEKEISDPTFRKLGWTFGIRIRLTYNGLDSRLIQYGLSDAKIRSIHSDIDAIVYLNKRKIEMGEE